MADESEGRFELEAENGDIGFRNRCSQFATLELRRRKLEDELKRIKKTVGELGDTIVEEMAETGITNMQVQGLTLYLRKSLVVNKGKDVDSGELCEALKANGLGDLVGESYSGSALKSAVKELLDSDEEIPPALASRLYIAEDVKLTSRKT